MSGHDDPLAAEREEAAAIRWDHEPRGRVIRGTYYEDAPSRAEAEAGVSGPTPSSPAWWCPRCSTPHQHGEPADGCECGWEQPPDPWPDAPRTVAARPTDHTDAPPF